MPNLVNENMETVKFGNNFGFSATRIEDLSDASEYTLVTLAIDESTSISEFKNDIENCVKEVVKSCQAHPKSGNLLFRVINFASDKREIHGFKLINTCQLSDYDNFVLPNGMTMLFDTVKNGIKAEATYGASLTEEGYKVNGLLVIITDGCDNMSSSIPEDIKREISNIYLEESLTNFTSILIGVNINSQIVADHLQDFKERANLNQFESIEDANAKTFSRIAGFISQSISSASQNINNSGPSQQLSI